MRCVYTSCIHTIFTNIHVQNMHMRTNLKKKTGWKAATCLLKVNFPAPGKSKNRLIYRLYTPIYDRNIRNTCAKNMKHKQKLQDRRYNEIVGSESQKMIVYDPYTRIYAKRIHRILKCKIWPKGPRNLLFAGPTG